MLISLREDENICLIVGAPQQFLAVLAIRQPAVSPYEKVVTICFHQLFLLVQLVSSMQPEHVAPHALISCCFLIARFALHRKFLLHNLSCRLAGSSVAWVAFGH